MLHARDTWIDSVETDKKVSILTWNLAILICPTVHWPNLPRGRKQENARQRLPTCIILSLRIGIRHCSQYSDNGVCVCACKILCCSTSLCGLNACVCACRPEKLFSSCEFYCPAQRDLFTSTMHSELSVSVWNVQRLRYKDWATYIPRCAALRWTGDKVRTPASSWNRCGCRKKLFCMFMHLHDSKPRTCLCPPCRKKKKKQDPALNHVPRKWSWHKFYGLGRRKREVLLWPTLGLSIGKIPQLIACLKTAFFPCPHSFTPLWRFPKTSNSQQNKSLSWNKDHLQKLTSPANNEFNPRRVNCPTANLMSPCCPVLLALHSSDEHDSENT